MYDKGTYILNTKVNFYVDKSQVLSSIVQLLRVPGCHHVSTTNAEFLMTALTDPSFRSIINSAALSLPDGAGLLYAHAYLQRLQRIEKDRFFPLRALLQGCALGITSFYKDVQLSTRFSGVRLVHDLCELSAQRGFNVFLLGGWPKDFWGHLQDKASFDLSKRAALRLGILYPKLNIIGATSAFSPLPCDDTTTCSYIKKCMTLHNVTQIDFFFVAYGHPAQEQWFMRNRHKIPAKVSFGIGGTFDYLAGTQSRAPRFFIKHNMEWFYRLLMQPWRFNRIFSAFPQFPLLVYKTSLRDLG